MFLSIAAWRMTLERMKRSEWIGFAPSYVGKVRANHTADYCEGGSKSMIVERKDNGDLSAYCFRCHRSGFVRASGASYPRVASKRASDASGCAGAHRSASEDEPGHPLPASRAGGSPKRTGPSGRVGGWESYPPLAVKWLGDARVSPVITAREGIVWDLDSQELFIPIHNNGRRVGWQARRFDEDRRKYDTIREDKDNFFCHYTTGSKTLVLVEDALSALRCSEICDSIGLLGVGLSPAMLSAIMAQEYTDAVVFLDGDNPQVKLAARKIANRLPFLRTKIVETGSNPKDYSKEELECLILK